MTKPISVNVFATNGVEVSSVEYNISSDTKRKILNALSLIRQSPDIKSCEIDGHSIWGDIKLYDSTIDDKHREEILNGDDMDFRSDIQRIIIKTNGQIHLKAYGKWDDTQYLTFNID